MKNRKHPLRGRQGFSLIELISILIVIGFILMFSARLLFQAYQTHQHGVELLNHGHQLQNLATRFRSDCHDATSAVDEDDGLSLKAADESTIRYWQQGKAIVREVQVEHKVIATNRWLFSSDLKFNADVDHSQSLSLAHLSLVFANTETGLDTVFWKTRIGRY